jgi:hypothetical protein
MFEDMVCVVEAWFRRDTIKNKKAFLDTPKEDLSKYYHSTLGRTIRNEFKLWETEWKPDVRDGIDHSPDHPDHISMRVIEEVWERLKSC